MKKNICNSYTVRGICLLECIELKLTDWKVRGSNSTSASRLLLSRLWQPGSIPALVPRSIGMAARHRKGATAEQLLYYYYAMRPSIIGSRDLMQNPKMLRFSLLPHLSCIF
ncbi:hypothetical protein CSKR_106793 [Clonorchis sinensis]|uniref:Uncharacterized protein n=1 Tax=Clonorchis sinensis TaxID=79923 RepID=A0A3R7EUU8_CLOSI|nr:hypothetical protein CSKR_106793 [Clonorchis sinensis]